jgi:hypothetical protein
MEEEMAPDETQNVMYRNREAVYSQFKQTAPSLDNVQNYLADRLASDRLWIDFKASIQLITQVCTNNLK